MQKTMNRMEYIHYGSKKFTPKLFHPITNYSVKPDGGLWASPVNAKYGWKEFCTREGFRVEKLRTSFKFTLAENANILRLTSAAQLNELPKAPNNIDKEYAAVFLDFEKLMADGVDAIQVNITGDGLYNKLNGWDCDSILILNKNIIMTDKKPSD